MLLPSLPHWRSHISTCPALRRVAIVSVTRVLGYDALLRLGREKGKGKPTTGGFGRSEFAGLLSSPPSRGTLQSGLARYDVHVQVCRL